MKIMKMSKTLLFVFSGLLFVPYICIAQGASPLKVTSGELSIVLGENASAVELRGANLFRQRVKERTGLDIKITTSVTTNHVLIIGTCKSNSMVKDYCCRNETAKVLKKDGFYLHTIEDNNSFSYVIGENISGVIAGIGKFLRLCRYAQGTLTIPQVKLYENPVMSIRGMYFATHFGNFYHVAPLEKVDEVIEEMALWGANSLAVWFDMHHWKSFNDPAAQEHLRRLRHFAKTAQGAGMDFGLVFLANEAYATSPEALRATRAEGVAAYGVELCPSKPKALKLIGKWQAEVIDGFDKVDHIWSWPYDQGGCACEKCKPYSGNGFIRASKQLADLYHERFPDGQVWLSTWWFDIHSRTGEYDSFFKHLEEKKPEWLTGILNGEIGPFHRVFDRPLQKKYPLAWFPEISMFAMTPWGGFGANPCPEHFTKIAVELKNRIIGGWPYSEGIYEDINKFFWVQFFWNPERKADDVLKEYAGYYLSPDSADKGVELFKLLEKTHERSHFSISNLQESGDIWNLTRSIDQNLPNWAKSSWRWRIIYIRSEIDHIVKNQGYLELQARKSIEVLLDELNKIYCGGRWVAKLPELTQR